MLLLLRTCSSPRQAAMNVASSHRFVSTHSVYSAKSTSEYCPTLFNASAARLSKLEQPSFADECCSYLTKHVKPCDVSLASTVDVLLYTSVAGRFESVSRQRASVSQSRPLTSRLMAMRMCHGAVSMRNAVSYCRSFYTNLLSHAFDTQKCSHDSLCL